MTQPVQFTPPSRALQRKIGGSAYAQVTPGLVGNADRAVGALAGEILADVKTMLDEIEAAARSGAPDAAKTIVANAHHIRGLAGTYGYSLLGRAAHHLQRYLYDAPDGFRPDAGLVQSIVIAAQHTVRDPKDESPALAAVVADSGRAIDVVRQREGRGLADV